MSWLESKPPESEGLTFDVAGYETLYANKTPVTNDKRFLYKSEATFPNLPTGEQWKLYAVWINRSQEHRRYLQVERWFEEYYKYLKDNLWTRKSNQTGTHEVITFGHTSIIRFYEREEKWDCVVTTSEEKLDLVLKLLYGIEKPEIPRLEKPAMQNMHNY